MSMHPCHAVPDASGEDLAATGTYRPGSGDTRAQASRKWWRAFGAIVLAASAGGAQAYVTVGPHGTFPTIQAGIAGLPPGDDVVRVEVKLCNDVHGFQYVCPYVENIQIATSTKSIYLSGAWKSDFQTQYTDGTRTLVKGNGSNASIIYVVAAGAFTVSISGFDLNGSGITSGSGTRGISAVAASGATITIIDNMIRNNSVLTPSAEPGGGGGAIAAASRNAGSVINILDNTLQSNVAYGNDANATYGGAVVLYTATVGHIFFNLNTLTNNAVANPNGGGCHGGGVYAQANTGAMQLYGNTYTGNQQFGCTSGATGDAVEIDALNASAVNIQNETWTSNAVASNPGVYEVFIHAEASANIYAGNGLITHGTWGGLYAQSDATATITIANFTIADNPVIGYHGVGSGTQLWNTILWNDGSPYGLDSGATFAFCLYASDPKFVDSPAGNYRLLTGSPAINAGYNAVPGGSYNADLDSSPRPYTGDGVSIADIGAFEYHQFDRIFLGTFEP